MTRKRRRLYVIGPGLSPVFAGPVLSVGLPDSCVFFSPTELAGANRRRRINASHEWPRRTGFVVRTQTITFATHR